MAPTRTLSVCAHFALARMTTRPTVYVLLVLPPLFSAGGIHFDWKTDILSPLGVLLGACSVTFWLAARRRDPPDVDQRQGDTLAPIGVHKKLGVSPFTQTRATPGVGLNNYNKLCCGARSLLIPCYIMSS
ncbi:uncharacterized protein EI90DRAFT_3044310 [Cantharellus anzutake]|uniref:uncharacterized protein n=1 Tax=Cantharellus anzutake TaxID=1750568 RepID=UPI001908AFE9|nr:uncharacterized protein EI90DRAFT_3044310 [Cantharellus anzutake]KAF8336951.1 hypothetical protein EI90DRAFT_3044310 [Cantharellus anzutake]